VLCSSMNFKLLLGLGGVVWLALGQQAVYVV